MSEETKATTGYRVDTSGESVLNAQGCGSQLCIIPAWLHKRITELVCYLVNAGSTRDEIRLVVWGENKNNNFVS